MSGARISAVWTVAVLLSGLAFPSAASAGFTALPLKAELDLAQNVVVGKITDIVGDAGEPKGSVAWGTATIAVSEMLKGKPAKEVSARVAIWVANAEMQSPPRAYRKGEEGIWILMPDGRPSHGYGLLEKERLEDIKRMLRELDKRTWSKPVNEICVWAGAEPEAPTWRSLHGQGVVLMFAGKNVSDKGINLPLSLYQEVVVAVLRDSTGKEYKLTGLGNRSERDDGPVPSRPLPPGVTRYMHPDGANYGFFQLPKDLPPGEYAVTITLTNNQAEGREPGTDDKNPVKLWQGTVTSPTIKVTVPKKERPTSRAAAQAQVSHFPLPSVGTGREYQPPGRSMTLATGEPRAASFRPMFPTLSP